jgi:hypothetical protein
LNSFLCKTRFSEISPLAFSFFPFLAESRKDYGLERDSLRLAFMVFPIELKFVIKFMASPLDDNC